MSSDLITNFDRYFGNIGSHVKQLNWLQDILLHFFFGENQISSIANEISHRNLHIQLKRGKNDATCEK